MGRAVIDSLCARALSVCCACVSSLLADLIAKRLLIVQVGRAALGVEGPRGAIRAKPRPPVLIAGRDERREVL